jgi:septal ring factor EnvC (AmiA/AmiB activator)
MKRRFLIPLLLLCASPVAAKPSEELRQLEQQMDEKKKQQEQLEATAKAAGQNLDALRQRMIDATQSLQARQGEQDTIEDKMDDLTQQIGEKSQHADEEKRQLAAMVSALVEIASRPPESLFLQDRVTSDHIHRSLLLKAILPQLRERAESAARDLAALYDLQAQLSQQKKLAEAAQTNLERQQRDLDQMIATRQGFLQRTEQQKADVAQHLADLADQARDLRQLMEKVAPTQKAAPVPKSQRDTTALKWPVSGGIKKHYGDRDADGVTSEGLTFAASSGAPVVAPRAGKVVFLGPFRGYGLIMILQHAGGYHSFLSGFGRIDAEMGQEVASGEPLGVLPAAKGTKPELYFEWRRGDDPVDPAGGLGK